MKNFQILLIFLLALNEFSRPVYCYMQPIRLRSFNIHSLQKLREQRKAYEKQQLELEKMMVDQKLKMLKEVAEDSPKTATNLIGERSRGSKSFWHNFYPNRFF